MSKKMSKTVTVSLVAAAAAATAGAIVYVASSNNVSNPDDAKVDVYTGAKPWEVCMTSGRTADDCLKGWKDAKTEHERTAVRYSSLEECEALTKTRCTDGSEQLDARAQSTSDTTTPSSSSGSSTTTQQGGGGSYWAYMLGYHMGQNNNTGPVYRDRSTSAPVTGTGSAFKTATNGSTTFNRQGAPSTAYKTDPYTRTPSPQPTPPSRPSAPPNPSTPPPGNNSGQSHATPTQTTRSTPASTPSSTTTTSQRSGFGGSAPAPSSSS